MLAIAVSLSVQLYLSQSLDVDGMIFGALSGLVVLFVSGAMKKGEADELITNGMNMMAFIGFVMLAAAGFASVLEKTGDVKALVEASTGMISHNQVIGALLMLVVGLLITMGIGSSFATIPIITTILFRFACSSASARWRRSPLSERLPHWVMRVLRPVTVRLARHQV